MEYILIQFTEGLNCQAYQEISNGNLQRYLDLQGSPLTPPLITESHVINATPERLDWMQ